MHNRFTVFLQEIVPLNDTAERKKYEVLIRLIDRTGTIIAPFHFRFGKRMHVYHQLTRFVIRQLIRGIRTSLRRLDQSCQRRYSQCRNRFIFAIDAPSPSDAEKAYYDRAAGDEVVT